MMKRHIFALMLALWCGAGGTQIFAQTSKTIYVTAEATDDGTGASWQSPTTLQKALEKAVAGDEIWVRGYAQNTAATTYYAPDLNGFRLKSGVKLYGGFAGTEKLITERKQGANLYEFATPSVISADLGQNDVTSADLLIYPQNTTRSDNARHALVMDLGVAESSTNLNGNSAVTLLNGFTIKGGNADGEATATVDTEATEAQNAEHGGGVLVINQTEDNNQAKRTFEISQCFMTDNFGRYGGAIYVDKSITEQGVIKYSAIYNNVAATRTANKNQGGGIWAEGATLIHNSLIFNNENGGIALSDRTKVVNCTMVHNTASSADLTSAELKDKELENGDGALYSTVFWGNSTLSKTETRPQFYNCAYPEVRDEANDDMDDNANLYISTNNFVSSMGDFGAWFVTPTSTVGYDHTFASNSYANYPNYSFQLEEESHLMNMGDMMGVDAYHNYVGYASADSYDLAGNTRIQGKSDGDGTAIDIGAYERKDLSSKRRYVAADAPEGGDGTTWETAYNDLQTAIDYVADHFGEGEVWVKEGTYSPKTRVGGSDDIYPLSFRMRDGVNVYGGFQGPYERYGTKYEGETSITKRERNYYQEASDNGSASAEGTTHVAWAYTHPTILQGDSYQSGSATWSAASEQWNVSSKSCHVVWFAPLPTDAADFSQSTLLDGFIIEGGSNTSNSTVSESYMPYKGAGVYINSGNALMRNCMVRNNSIDLGVSAGQGGGVYCQNGQVRNSLIYNNSANRGGGLYMENVGFLDNSIVSNNSAVLGGGVYMCKSNALYPDNYMVLATSVVANNQSTRNAGVYVEGSALIEQNTIVNNYTSNVTDATNKQTAYTGGLYLTQYGLIINNIIWNNTLHTSSTTTSARSSSLAQIYADSPSRSQTRFYNNALSNVNASTWNNIYQSGTVELDNGSPWLAFANPAMLDVGNEEKNYENFAKVMTQRGVQSAWPYINYYWQACKGSVLRTGGLHYSQLTDNIIFRPPTDLREQNFEANPPIGAFKPEAYGYVFERTAMANGGNKLRLYYNRDQTVQLGSNPDWDEIIEGLKQNGSSWTKAIRSLNDALSYINTALTSNNGEIEIDAPGNEAYYTVDPTKDQFEIVCRAGQNVPQTPYNYQINNALARTITLPAIATTMPVRIVGGYPDELTMANPTDDDRKPLKYRTVFTGLESSATELNEGLYHIFRMETGGNYQLEGLCIEGGYAAGTANIPYGGGILIGSVTTIDAPTHLALTDCVLQNNTAYDGAAIATMNDARNVTVKLTNCVVNNNTSHNEVDNVTGDVIELNDASNTIAYNHVTMVNNIGRAPAAAVLGNTSFAAGNVLSQSSSRGTKVQSSTDDSGVAPHLFGSDGANNTFSLATTGKDGALNFDNPTNETGAVISGNVYYGGDASFRPITSSLANNVIINQATVTSDDTDHSIEMTDRDLGGEPDLGAFEAVLPRSGTVIYVRAYNTVVPDNYEDEQTSEGTPYDCIDGTPDFNLLNDNPSNVYDGRSWGRAIMGNAICNVKKERIDNEFYVRDTQGKLLAATLDNSLYGNDYNARTAPYGQTSNAYGAFFSAGTSSVKNGNQASVWNSTTRRNENIITNDRDEQYVSGLQYAVEMAAQHNRDYPDEDSVVVWVAGGVYTDFKGFVIRNGVKVYGGYCSEGNPGEDDRRPLLSQYVPARKGYEGLKKAEYETILQVRKETPVYLTNSSREIWWSEGKPSDGSNYDYFDKAVSASKTIRHTVLYQPDVCLPTWGVSGDGLGSTVGANQYRYEGQYADSKYQEYTGVKWDGFTIRHGYIANYEANRDGGAGVRAFRGIRLENLIVVNNATHGKRARGGGLYLDGDNSVISNSYLLRNIVWGNSDCYGGGAYMIQGVGYNMVVASNRASSPGGGIFIESAKFYNNTVAYNMSNKPEGTGIMHWQDNTTGIESQLTLYNCLVYDNMKNGSSTLQGQQIGSSSTTKFQRSYNCYVNSDMGSLSSKFTTADGNVTGASIAFPFSITGYSTKTNGSATTDIRFRKARAYNDFRLNEDAGLSGNPCLNGGTENMPNMPDYDMDYTNRIKDCAIDIGAYEADNTENIQPQERTRKVKVTTTTATGGTTTKEVDETYYVYYVTQNGYGNRSGDSPQNAACADKLQSVLTKAGLLVNELFDKNDAYTPVYVKVAGYASDDNGLRFTYHANTLGNPDDPQSYTFLIPEGVMLMGGYNEGNPNDPTTYNWDDDQRDVMTDYQTILSARTQLQSGSSITQEVNGYHVVTFGTYPSYPETDLGDYYKHALRGRTNTAGKLLHPRTGIEGVRLVDGKATDNTVFKSMGGGAIVPSYAIVRNCVVTDCKALKGGALYLLPGSVTAGCVMHDNEATDGGAVYAACGDTIDGSQQYRAYIASCTIAENHANGLGGGVYQELGALLAGNTVIWGNTATTDNNISGVVDRTFKDMIHALLSQGLADGQVADNQYYPYNNCFVEGYLLPANTQNDRMESELLTYFSNVGEYYPRAYSPLIEQGVDVNYHKLWMRMGAPAYDMLGVMRGEGVDKLTAGAYALYAPKVPEGKLLRRLFVSADGGAEVSAEDRAKYIGRSFYTPFNSLEAAIAYINNVRETGLASNKDKFEILMTGGTYKPSQARTDSTNSGLVVDRRLQSFVIPVNVSIYGSFHDTDPYSSDPVDPSNTSLVDDTEDTFDSIQTESGPVTLHPNRPILEILAVRNNEAHMTDINKNQLIEPWEFSRPTIFSGDIKASSNEKHVYHVVYSEIPDPSQSSAANDNDVLLDGITIMDGQTTDSIHVDDNGDEVRDNIGHGGGIYSRYVSYTLNRCRLLDNKGVHGGAMFIQDASCDIINTLVAGNWAGSEDDKSNIGGHGGAINVYISDDERRGTKDIVNRGNFHAVNSIFANNTAYESTGRATYPALGGALYVRRPLIKYDKTYHDVFIANCLFVSNSVTGLDSKGTAIYYAGPDDETPYEEYYRDEVSSDFANYLPSVYNTVLWNNKLVTARGEVSSPAALTVATEYDMRYCASDALYLGLWNSDLSVDPELANDPTHHNVLLSEQNFTATGPRFAEPTTVVGIGGYNVDAKWNPAAISILTDAGLGTPEAKNEGDAMDNAYLAWWSLHNPRLYDLKYNDDKLNYITYATQSGVTSARGRSTYERYLGPQDVDGTTGVQTIDIGMYEFQYLFNGFSDYSAIYIGTQDHGTGDGSTWDNRSSDLYGAIVAVGNPTGDTSVGAISSDRKIYVEGGEYYSPSYKGYDAFTLSVTSDPDKLKTLNSIEIIGALTNASNDPVTKKHLGEVRDFSRPTILAPNPAKSRTDNLLNVTTTSRPIRLSGLSFRNHYEGATGGNGLNVLATRPTDESELAQGYTGNVTLQNNSFLGNDGSGMIVSSGTTADILAFNALYAENGSYGLVTPQQHTTLVNTTFAQNASGDINLSDATAAGETLPAVYNSTSWNNASEKADYVSALPTAAEQKNVVFAAGQKNDDVLAGPCFTDPDTHDYSIRPSFSLMGMADSLLYDRHVGTADTLHVDLASNARFFKGGIDVGAYQCNADQMQIIYVDNRVNDDTGESWAKATNSLQNAVNLAELFANKNKDKYAYVFATKRVNTQQLKVMLPGVRVYGGMEGNESEKRKNSDDEKNEPFTPEQKVDTLLLQRPSIISGTRHTTIANLEMDFDQSETEQRSSAVDGFFFTGSTINAQRGTIGTSVIESGTKVTGSADAVLYNSLVDEQSSVKDLTEVSNTFVSKTYDNGNEADILTSAAGNAANRVINSDNAEKVNHYVTSAYWRYQLNDTELCDPTCDRADGCINVVDDEGTPMDSTATVAQANIVGHRTDLAGNRRFRDALDRGCFETWYLLNDHKATRYDYPHGESVVYVDKERKVTNADGSTEMRGIELKLDSLLFTPRNPFSPGFLLLRHHAGMRSLGATVSLTNFAVERFLKKDESSLFVMPFTAIQRDMYACDEEGNPILGSTIDNDSYTSYTYDGLARSQYTFRYGKTEGNAWSRDLSPANQHATTGVRVDPKAQFTIRYYGNSYTENTEAVATKGMTVTQYNYQEPWSSGNTDGLRFTYKENMGWNLLGSPYLCAMNYADMSYGRMIYVYSGEDNAYMPINTAGMTSGHIPAFDAWFTQTATLNSYENFSVKCINERQGSAYELNTDIGVDFGPSAENTVGATPRQRANSADETTAQRDVLHLSLAAPTEARAYFDLSADGVKFVDESQSQLFAEREGGRYSMLTALNDETALPVGVNIPKAGSYTFSLPVDNAADEACEAIYLNDLEKGRSVNLKREAYRFTATEAGVLSGRFTLTFRAAALPDGSTDAESIRIVPQPQQQRIEVSGLQEGDVVRLFTTSGQLLTTQRAESELLYLPTAQRGVHIVEVRRSGRGIKARKVVL